MDISGNMHATPACTPIQHTPSLAPYITDVSVTCTLPGMPGHRLVPTTLEHTNHASVPQRNSPERFAQGNTQASLPTASTAADTQHAVAVSSRALQLVIGTSLPCTVSYVILAPASSSSELHNSILFSRAVSEANFTADAVFSGTLTTEDDRSTAGIEVIDAGSAYTSVRKAPNGTFHASIKLVTCSVDFEGPLALLVAAASPGRGHSSVYVHILHHLDDCMRGSAEPVLAAHEGVQTLCARGATFVCHMFYDADTSVGRKS